MKLDLEEIAISIWIGGVALGFLVVIGILAIAVMIGILAIAVMIGMLAMAVMVTACHFFPYSLLVIPGAFILWLIGRSLRKVSLK